MKPTSPHCGLGARASIGDVGGEKRKYLFPARPAGSHANRGHGKIPLVAALPDLPHLLEQNGLGTTRGWPSDKATSSPVLHAANRGGTEGARKFGQNER
jgi:hypothetical protein